MKHTKTEYYYTDDFTGGEIVVRGWTLSGLNTEETGRSYHFQSLSNLLKALDTKATLFGLSRDDILPLW